MMQVWASTRNSEKAQEWVRALIAKGEQAHEANVRHFDPAQIDADVTHAYHDGSRRGVVDVFRERGIPCEMIPGIEAVRVEDRPPVTGYEIIENGPWYSVIGPGGKVGKSVRTRAEAESILAGATNANT